MSNTTAATSLFRVDAFKVPAAARAAFAARLQRIDALLARQPGCRQNLVLTQPDGVDFKMVTLVEWADEASLQAARAVAQAGYAAEGFDPASFMRAHGITADFGTYAALPS